MFIILTNRGNALKKHRARMRGVFFKIVIGFAYTLTPTSNTPFCNLSEWWIPYSGFQFFRVAAINPLEMNMDE